MTKIKWARLIPHRQTWAFVVGKFLTDPIWWFYLFWIPDFLQRKHGLSLMKIGLPIVVIYVIADVGSVAGGWLSSWLIHRGKSVNFARKTALLICARVRCAHRVCLQHGELVGSGPADRTCGARRIRDFPPICLP